MILTYVVGGSTYTVNNVKLTRFATENLYDGDGFNRTGRKHLVEGSGVIQSTSDPFTGTIANIRQGLNRPRGTLSLKFDDGSTVALASASDSGTATADMRNGPLPNVTVSEIVGSNGVNAVFVGFSFAFFNCGDTRIQRFEMIVTQSIDEAGFITMSRSGTLSVSRKSEGASIADTPNTIMTAPGQNNGTGNSPDLYRRLVAGKPPPGFRRTKQDYTLDASLHNLTFSVEDRLVFRDLKYPVMMGDASFDYQRGLDNPLGIKTFRCHFEGEVTTPPQQLVAIAYEAAQARIDFANDMIQSISLRETNIYTRNRIELEITAQGQGGLDGKLDTSVIKKMFSPPHATGGTRYVNAYPSRGVFLETNTFLEWDSCNAPSTIQSVVNNPDSGEETETTLTVLEISDDAPVGNPEDPKTTPVEPDAGMPQTANAIKHFESSQTYEIADTGMAYLEATGGAYQWPIQLRTPVVMITQTVRMVTTSSSQPIPWPQINDAFIVKAQTIAVNNAPIDATGKPTYAIVATRTIQAQASNSPNSVRKTGGDEMGGPPRLVYAPTSIAQARDPYSKDNQINTQQVDTGGSSKPMDFV